jgi:hypothetical protein
MHDCHDVVFLAVLSSKIIIEDSCMDLCLYPFFWSLCYISSLWLLQGAFKHQRIWSNVSPKGYHAMSDGRKDP